MILNYWSLNYRGSTVLNLSWIIKYLFLRNMDPLNSLEILISGPALIR